MTKGLASLFDPLLCESKITLFLVFVPNRKNPLETMADELAPIPPTPIATERTWKKTTKTTYKVRGDGSLRETVTVTESGSFKAAPGQEFTGCNGGNFLQAKLRPTGVKLDLAKEATPHQPHYK